MADSLTELATGPAVSNDNFVRSPSKVDHRISRVMSGTELSPLKLLGGNDIRSPSACSTGSTGSASGENNNFRTSISSATNPISPVEKAVRSPRKLPEKRFPVRVSSPTAGSRTRTGSEATTRSLSPERQSERQSLSIGEALLDNANLAKAIQLFEEEDNAAPDAGHNATIVEADESAIANDAEFTNLSNFSAIRLNQPQGSQDEEMTTPRASKSPEIGLNTKSSASNLLSNSMRLLNNGSSRGPSRQPSTNFSASTGGQQANSNEAFDIPPMPAPRNAPSVTPRELETLKSQFLSEISSLKASLLGKEAEVQSLKAAVSDAEKRVGESMEQMREERQLREQFSAEKEDWERRGREMEVVLRKIREDYAVTKRERDELESKLNESEGRREMAEMMAQDAESKMAGMRAGQQQLQAAAAQATSPGAPKSAASRSPAAATAREVEIAVERVARELHALYKSKHETKVAALKKSYEGRWEKKVAELEAKVSELESENDRVRQESLLSSSKTDPAQAQAEEERRMQAVNDQATLRQMEAEVDKLEAVLREVSRDNGDLRQMLEQERIEKGELVQLAEEMMAIQAAPAPQPEPQQQQQQQQQQQPLQQYQQQPPQQYQQQQQYQPQPQQQYMQPQDPQQYMHQEPQQYMQQPPQTQYMPQQQQYIHQQGPSQQYMQQPQQQYQQQAPAPQQQQQYHSQQYQHQDRFEQVARTPSKPPSATRSPARTSTGSMAPRPPSAASASSTGSGGSSNLRASTTKSRPMSMMAGTGISRPSGLRAPGGSTARASGPPSAHERHRSSVVMPRPGSSARTSMISSTSQRR
ncbi:hypothetical protein TD95_003966 [Thielaviopsis punctulata]|uniref:Uncharacterized protein n=1 Tax=Thielaviopsis punctulata TaxID=72032 RepID=A0A0F4Z8B3_9PEZI|nr:hypothetical protein TD95_003966 [Thielaviopsis punctulata]